MDNLHCIVFRCAYYLFLFNIAYSCYEQMWDGLFFQTATLRELGLRVQLGHAPGRHCPMREPCHKDFRVIHTNGIHQVYVDFCRCQPVPHHVQLLRLAWWPGTPIEPKTCTTMDALQQFDILNAQGKLTASLPSATIACSSIYPTIWGYLGCRCISIGLVSLNVYLYIYCRISYLPSSLWFESIDIQKH